MNNSTKNKKSWTEFQEKVITDALFSSLFASLISLPVPEVEMMNSRAVLPLCGTPKTDTKLHNRRSLTLITV